MGKFFFASFAVAAVAFLLFVPIHFYIDLYYDMRNRKLGFYVTVYDKIKIAGGYVEAITGGFAFHLSAKKALLFTYHDMEEERKKYSPQKGFQLMNVKVAIETGAEYFLPLLLIQKIAKVAVCFGAKNKRIFHGELALVNDDCFRLFAKIKIQITLFSQLCIFIKYLTGGMIAKCQKKMKNSTN